MIEEIIEDLRKIINSTLYNSDHLFQYISHFSIKKETVVEEAILRNDAYGMHVKVANKRVSYESFWKQLKYSLTSAVFGNVDSEIDQMCLDNKMSRNTASNQLFDNALKHFQQKNNQGKVGEVLLFLIIEKIFNATRIGSKFRITQSKEQQRASDSIHIGIINDNNKDWICYYIGESKFYQKLDRAIVEALKSLQDHRKEPNFKDELQWMKDANIIRDNKLLQYVDRLETYDYKICQVMLIIHYVEQSIDTKLETQEEIHISLKKTIEDKLNKAFNTSRVRDALKNFSYDEELHCIIFYLPHETEMKEKFKEVFGVELTPPRGKMKNNKEEVGQSDIS